MHIYLSWHLSPYRTTDKHRSEFITQERKKTIRHEGCSTCEVAFFVYRSIGRRLPFVHVLQVVFSIAAKEPKAEHVLCKSRIFICCSSRCGCLLMRWVAAVIHSNLEGADKASPSGCQFVDGTCFRFPQLGPSAFAGFGDDAHQLSLPCSFSSSFRPRRGPS